MKQSYLQPTFARYDIKMPTSDESQISISFVVRLSSSLPGIIRNKYGINIAFKSHGACIRYMIRVTHTREIRYLRVQ